MLVCVRLHGRVAAEVTRRNRFRAEIHLLTSAATILEHTLPNRVDREFAIECLNHTL